MCYLVIDGDKDYVIGVFNLKEILLVYVEYGFNLSFSIDFYVKLIICVIEIILIKELFFCM